MQQSTQTASRLPSNLPPDLSRRTTQLSATTPHRRRTLDRTLAMVGHLAGLVPTFAHPTVTFSYRDCLAMLHNELVKLEYSDHALMCTLWREGNCNQADTDCGSAAIQCGIDALTQLAPLSPTAIRTLLADQALGPVFCVCLLLAERLQPLLRQAESGLRTWLNQLTVAGRHEVRHWLCAA